MSNWYKWQYIFLQEIWINFEDPLKTIKFSTKQYNNGSISLWPVTKNGVSGLERGKNKWLLSSYNV